jgi:hypothetical protein
MQNDFDSFLSQYTYLVSNGIGNRTFNFRLATEVAKNHLLTTMQIANRPGSNDELAQFNNKRFENLLIGKPDQDTLFAFANKNDQLGYYAVNKETVFPVENAGVFYLAPKRDNINISPSLVVYPTEQELSVSSVLDLTNGN